jgi:hypothetical protein
MIHPAGLVAEAVVVLVGRHDLVHLETGAADPSAGASSPNDAIAHVESDAQGLLSMRARTLDVAATRLPANLHPQVDASLRAGCDALKIRTNAQPIGVHAGHVVLPLSLRRHRRASEL